MTGLNEAIEDAQSEGKKLNRRTVTIIPVKEYGAEQVRNIRNSVGMSQSTFAGYLGVTKKTVEAWEAGTNHPSGAASRILNMMEMDTELVEDYLAEGNAYRSDRKVIHKEATIKMLRVLSGDKNVDDTEEILKALDIAEEDEKISMCELFDQYTRRGISEKEAEEQMKLYW